MVKKKVIKSSVKEELEHLLFNSAGNVDEEGLLHYISRTQNSDAWQKRIAKARELFEKV